MVIPCQTNYWGISAVPSVHSHDSWLKLSCENIVPVVGKAVNCLCVLDLLLTCYWLRGTYKFLVWNREIWAERPQRYFHTLALTFCHKGHKLLYGEVELFTTVLNSVPVAQNSGAHGWLSLCSQFAAADTCLFPSLFSRKEESRDGWCTGHVPSTLLSDSKI